MRPTSESLGMKELSCGGAAGAAAGGAGAIDGAGATILGIGGGVADPAMAPGGRPTFTGGDNAGAGPPPAGGPDGGIGAPPSAGASVSVGGAERPLPPASALS